MGAAELLFARGRFHEVTLDEVAREAHVGKGTIYRYFEDKDDLFFQTATSGLDELCELIQHQEPGGATFHDHILAVCREVVSFFDRRRHLIRMMQSAEGHALKGPGRLRERWILRRGRLVAAVADVLERGRAAGDVRDDLPCEVLAVYLLGILRSRSNDLPGAPEGWRSLDLALEIFWSGARRPEAGAGTPVGG
jgi:AcrR family transcriptional regulator